MTKREQTGQSFASASPGELLKRRAMERQIEPIIAREERANSSVDVACDPFAHRPFVQALRERGVMLAPLLVQWNYKVPAALPFSKWLRTKEVLLSDARLQVNDNTAGVHYFGTYIVQSSVGAEMEEAGIRSVDCQTLWGYSDEVAMTHMFDLCRGRIERVSIVQNDLKDFVIGLKGHLAQVGPAHFSQTVLVAPATM
ncbi:MAG: hypothetical protein ACI89J_001138 [Hyphomicrobiaceae bacterium]|jgi:hypothetical protein